MKHLFFFFFEMGLPATSPTRNENVILEETQSNPSDIINYFSKHLIEMQSTSIQPNSTDVICNTKT